jgi:hypothetical protein
MFGIFAVLLAVFWIFCMILTSLGIGVYSSEQGISDDLVEGGFF